MLDDKILWSRIQLGDHNALKVLFDLHYKSMCSYALQFTRNMLDAEDLVQNEYVKLWIRRNELNIHTSVKSYLYKSVYHAYLQKNRKDKKNDKLLDSLKYEAMSYLLEEDNSELTLKTEKIREIVNTLPERCKEILLLSKKEGYKNREIAEKLGISIKTVESQIRIAFKKIRDGIGDGNLHLFLLFRALEKMK
ncbi:RNA polymerase sigma factor [Ulvibacterium marinum]|uniref:RNA polymerase sigma factor n=1 Tax=Ulvibacterium marinum TaxID=2419782 RepID=UPI00249592F2|nr:sigma-70 family RNA polymerase sigma factor [Ulvibacterium marinum]